MCTEDLKTGDRICFIEAIADPNNVYLVIFYLGELKKPFPTLIYDFDSDSAESFYNHTIVDLLEDEEELLTFLSNQKVLRFKKALRVPEGEERS